MKIILKNDLTGEKVTFEHPNLQYILSKVFYDAREQMKDFFKDNDLPKFEVIIRKGR